MIFGSKRTAKMELAMDKKRENKEKDGEKAQILTMELQKKKWQKVSIMMLQALFNGS